MLADASGLLAKLPTALNLTIQAAMGTDKDSTILFDVAGFRLHLAALLAHIGEADARAGPGVPG